MARLDLKKLSILLVATTAAATPNLAGASEVLSLGEALAEVSSPANLREHAVEIDTALLTSEAAAVELRLTDGQVYRAVRVGIERRGPDRFVWRGEIQMGPLPGPAGDVTLTVHDGYVVGRISTPSGAWVIQPRAAGGHSLAELDESRFPPCAGSHVPDLETGSVAAHVSSPGGADKAPKILRILAVYTAAARNGAGGKSQIEALIRASIDLTNTALRRSRVNARLRLAQAVLTDLPERFDIRQSLGEIRFDPAIRALRDRWNADMVAAIYENDNNFCGIASVMRNPGPNFAPFANSVTLRSCAVGNITFPHEIGHNLGLEHNPESGAPPGAASFPWAFGHGVDGVFRTVMAISTACPTGCVRQPNFSNPDILLSGLPSGIPEQRHNQRVLKVTAGITEQFRGETLVTAFAWAQGEPRTGAPVDFLDASAGNPTSWSWDFGDGGTSTEASPSHVFARAGTYTVSLTAANASMTQTVRQELEVRDPVCIPDTSTLCLNRDRFQVRVDWRDFEGETGGGTVTPATSSDSGLFWFFEADNWEMLIKVLDGCGLNQRFWVFAAATTNVEYTLRVVDTRTGFVSEYSNPLGTAAAAITDVDAFATCAEPAAASARDRFLVPAPEGGWTRTARRVPLDKEVPGTCAGAAEGLCLNRDRFLVEVEWQDFEGATGTGSAVPFGTDDSGILWFFEEDNWEMLVKVLDGCGVNRRFWVFSAATTDVRYTLRVTDTRTGEVREYVNELGNRAPAVTDVEAFATCS